MLISDLHECVRKVVIAKTESGDLSQTELASRLGIKQAHVSNFVYGRRRFSIELLDKVLTLLQLEVSDLLPAKHSSASSTSESVPMVALSSAMQPVIPADEIVDVVSFRRDLVRRLKADCGQQRKQWSRFIAVAVDSVGSSDPCLRNGAVLLIDRHCCALRMYKTLPNLYLVRMRDGFRVRQAELQGSVLCLRPQSCNGALDFIKIRRDQTIESYIVGRVSYAGAEI